MGLLQTSRSILGLPVAATDGRIGHVEDLYLDDRTWSVTHVVVDTGTWLPGRRVLLRPSQVGRPRGGRSLPVELTRRQVRQAMPRERELPLERRAEMDLAKQFGWANPWEFRPMVEDSVSRGAAAEAIAQVRRDVEARSPHHLRGTNEIVGYRIVARDGRIGRLADVVLDAEAWAVRYLVVDTRTWLPGRRVLIAPDWIVRVSWADRLVRVDQTRRQIRGAPRYDPSQPVNRQYEVQLYDYYGRPGYWSALPHRRRQTG